MDSTAEQVDVVVVGAGFNGLISAKTYLDFEPSANLVIIDEQGSFGGVWSTEKIYPSLYAQIKHGLFEYSFYPMKHEGITEDGYISGETIHTYLTDFAWDYDLVRRTRLRTTVKQVLRTPSGGWRLEIENKAPIECEKLIYASGATSHPVIPAWPKTNFTSPIIHSCETGTHLDALDKIQSATVIGGAKSSYDTVFFLLKAGKKVDWIIREDGSGPLAIMPPTLLGLANTMDVVTTRFVTLMGMSIMSTDGPGHQFFQRTPVGRFIVWVFWLIVNWIADRHAGYSKSENAKKLRPGPEGNGIFWANAGLGAASVPLFWKTFHRGDCTVHRTDVDLLSENNIVSLKNGERFETDYVILCTGFDKSFQVFSEELQQQLGFLNAPDEADKWAKLDAEATETVDELLPYLKNSPFGQKTFDRETTAGGRKLLHGPSRHYRRLIVPKLAAQGDRSVFFPGFIHSIFTPTVSEVQALWGVAFLLGLVDLPAQEEMEQEVAEWNVWSGKRYVAQGRKHAYAIFDFIPYIDTLLGDLDINSRRKKNWFAHLFTPAYPREYNGLVDEFRQALAKKQDSEGTISGTMTPLSVDSETLSVGSDGLSVAPPANGHNTSVKPLGFS
ncbi:cofactor fmo1 fad enzyme [Trichoderma cornu-damae]|uniref:Cofactor fmo1 fad enzyme n=1 Tax=Trichoderma cornu-damae TaxID=654480 RepID=A0A9P8QFV6_9HYPO|nr:cofactor fmo1 fad enzyme [Trichoderma cornu-damae]